MGERVIDKTVEKTVNAAMRGDARGGGRATGSPTTRPSSSATPRTTASRRPKKPHLVVMPENTGEVQEVVRIAGRYGMGVQPSSAAMNCAGGCIPQRGGILLDLRRMDAILDVDTDNLCVTIQPSVRFGVLQNLLKSRASTPSTPPGRTPREVATNHMDKGIGMPANKYGVGPDHIVSMTFVMPDGELLRTGSSALPGGGEGLRGRSRAGPLRHLPLLHGHLRGDGGDDHPDLREAAVDLLEVATFESEDLTPVVEFFYDVTREDFVNDAPTCRTPTSPGSRRRRTTWPSRWWR